MTLENMTHSNSSSSHEESWYSLTLAWNLLLARKRRAIIKFTVSKNVHLVLNQCDKPNKSSLKSQYDKQQGQFNHENTSDKPRSRDIL